MRNVCLKVAVLALALVGLAGGAMRTEAQTIQTLVQFTNSWRYDQSGRQLPANWMTSAYTEDAQWAALSPGLLGFEPDTPAGYTAHAPILTPLSVSGSVTTYYFRTTFNYAGSLANVTLISTNLVDDGCAIYLNGLRVGGVRIPTGYNALNSALFFAGGTEGALEVVAFTNVSALRAGANLLAVEVHQSANPSSDVMFGMKLLSIVPNQLAITNQPQDEAVLAGDTATFTVGVSGGPATYRWFRGTTLLTSTSNTLNIANAQVANAGTNYFVVVSNVVNVVTSRLATLTIVSDTEGPQMLRAVIANTPCGGGAAFSTNSINIVFASRDGRDPCTDGVPQEPLNANSARNIDNYRLISSTNSNIQVPILSILYSSALGVLLNVDGSNANWNPTHSYYLIVNNLADDRGNNINPNTVIGVSSLVITNLTQIADTWNFYANAFFDPAWPGIYSQFHQTNFVIDPTYWGTGQGVFWYDDFPMNTLCGGLLGPQIPNQGTIPTLFRRTFRLPAGFGSTTTFRLRYVVDDGMVLYLNGVEIHRFNMPAGPFTELTQAIVPIENPTCMTNVMVTVTNLFPGTNWLAAAIHQAPDSKNDMYFGLEMDAVTLKTSSAPTNRPPAPRLAYTRVLTSGGRHFVLSWPATNYGYTLQYSTNIDSVGPLGTHDVNWWMNSANWTQVADQANPYTNRVPPTTGPRRFYRLFRETLN